MAAAAAVEVDEFGLPVSANCTKLGHRKGRLVHTHVPISYTDWTLVPEKYKDDVWNGLKEEYDLPEASKTSTLKGMAGPWRILKTELRRGYYDKYTTHEQRIEHIPPKVLREDWIKFCENENTEEVQTRRMELKRKRESYDYSHTSGRKPHALVKAELVAANPELEVTTSDVWLKVHTQVGGAILPSTQPYVDKLKEQQEEIKELQAAGALVEEPRALTALFGTDTRGRARSVGPISRTQTQLCVPVCGKEADLKGKDGVITQRVEELGGKMDVLIEAFGSICKVVKDIQSVLPAAAALNMDINSRVQYCAQANGGSPQTGSNHLANSPGGWAGSASQSEIRGENPHCSLVNIEGEIIANGRMCTDDLACLFNSVPVPANLAKVVLDEILLPDEIPVKANTFVTTFREVRVGGFVLHPKMCIDIN